MPVAASADRADVLRGIRTFAQVVQYLVDVQGWPLDKPDDLTDVTYDWDTEELGIPAERVTDLTRFQQMRPLTAKQPWGVFFLEFSGPRLRYGPIRRLLRALVTKKRATGSDLRTWDLNDLLFIVITGTGDVVEVHVLAFRGASPQTAEFRSLSWRPDHTPELHLRRLSEELLPCLAWPEDPSDTESWRDSWWEAFKLPVGQAIRDSARLAERMAKTAQDLRDQIRGALAREGGSGPFTSLMAEIREQLVSDVTADKFSDMCAQTLVYGMLSSRVTNPQDFGSSPVFSAVPVANPFLEALFEQVYDEAAALDLAGSALPQFAADLRETNVEAILDQIGSTAKGGDPVIHFYEEFLKKYDSKMRADAGAFYTPQPAVEFIVRAVDEVLKSRFGLPMGIADAATWQEVADRNGFDVPEGVDPAKQFVSMIDPATGTGTFLVEWLRQARRSFEEQAPPDQWPEHLRDRLLPSMHAFELMLAPYAIAHLKVALELHTAGVSDGAMQILLTDTLEHEARQGQLATMVTPVAQEGRKAADLKENERFTVVVGNPPYDLEQHASGDDSKRKGGVVRYGAPGVAPRLDAEGAFRRASTGGAREADRIVPLLDSVTEPMRAAGLGRHLKNVYNDYIYFWRWAVWQAIELPPGPGVVAFITASSYLEGVSMGGVRHLLRRAFDELWIVDLGGEGRGPLTEDNIFDIRTPVAIAVGVRTRQGAEGCNLHHLKIPGTRSEKLARLAQLSLAQVATVVPGGGLDRMTPLTASQYHDWLAVTDLFPWIRSGCKFGRTWPIAEARAPLKGRWRELLSVVPRSRSGLFADTPSGQKSTSNPRPLLSSGTRLQPVESLDVADEPEAYSHYGYRSFDRQWVIADHRLIDRAGPHLWNTRGSRQLYLTTLTSTRLGSGPVLTATPYVPDLHHFRGSYGAKDVMPLHRDPHGREPNVTDNLLPALSEALGIELAAEDLLAYVYALGGTAAFSECFADELAEAAGPVHIPITADPDLFRQAVALGRDLLWWHTWGERFVPDGQSSLPEGQAKELTPVEGMPEKPDYDPESQTLIVGTGTFGPVSPAAWDFEVSGLRVLRSWARLPHEGPQRQEVQPPRRHPPHPLDPDQRAPAGAVHHRAHHRGHASSRRPPRPDRLRPSDPSR